MDSVAPSPTPPPIVLPEFDRANLENAAAELLSSFREDDQSEKASRRSTWQPERMPTLNLAKENFIGPLVMERPDLNTFTIQEIRVEFEGRGYVLDSHGCHLLDRLAEHWSSHPRLSGLSTSARMRDRLREWCIQVLDSQQFSSSVDAVLSQLNGEIGSHEVWIGLADIDVQHPFAMGKVEIRSVDADQVRAWLQILRDAHIEEPLWAATKRRLESDWQGHTVAIYRGWGDLSAVEAMAVEHTERACAFLRTIDPGNQSAIQRSYLQPLTLASQWGARNLMIDPIQPHSKWLRHSVFNPPYGITVTNELFQSQWEEGGLRPLHELLSVDKPTPFQDRLTQAILVYSRHRLSADPVEKLIFAIAGTETMLLRDGDHHGIKYTLRRRLSALLADNIDQRKALQDEVDQAYRRRSEFLHHGSGIDDRRHVESFLRHVWCYFIFAINHHTHWPTLRDHHDELEAAYKAKFSGASDGE